MIRILEEIFGLRKKREEFTPSEEKISDNLYREGYYTSKGEWRISEKCTAEYNMGNDRLQGGCGHEQQVSEYDFEGTLYYCWKCEVCGMWHGIYEGRIPDEVKQRIKIRRQLIKSGKIVKLKDYKKKAR